MPEITSSPAFETELDALLRSSRVRDAIALAQQAADRRNPSALMQLAVWRLAGWPLDRDLLQARALLRRAVQIGHVDAALMEIALTANGTGGVSDWQGARRLLDDASDGDSVAAYQRDLVNKMTLNDDGFPFTSAPHRQLHDAPLVRVAPDFLSPEECQHLAHISSSLLAPSVIVDPATGETRPHEVRTSDGASIGPANEDLVVRAINARIAAFSSTPVDNGEPLAILRYSPGQEYRLHSDALPGRKERRFCTVILYLNEGFEGGETDFPAIGLRIRPKAGMALQFSNLRQNGTPDPLARHAGLPVIRGVKWIATRWIREQRYDPWSAA